MVQIRHGDFDRGLSIGRRLHVRSPTPLALPAFECRSDHTAAHGISRPRVAGDKDGRIRRVRLTPAGRALAERTLATLRASGEELFGTGLSPRRSRGLRACSARHYSRSSAEAMRVAATLTNGRVVKRGA